MSRHPVAHEETASAAVRTRSGPIDRIRVSAYTVPTDFPEADGTFQWTETTMVVVEAEGCGHRAPATRMRTRRRPCWRTRWQPTFWGWTCSRPARPGSRCGGRCGTTVGRGV